MLTKPDLFQAFLFVIEARSDWEIAVLRLTEGMLMVEVKWNSSL